MTLPRNQPRAYHLREAAAELLALMELLNLIDMATAKIGESEGAATGSAASDGDGDGDGAPSPVLYGACVMSLALIALHVLLGLARNVDTTGCGRRSSVAFQSFTNRAHRMVFVVRE